MRERRGRIHLLRDCSTVVFGNGEISGSGSDEVFFIYVGLSAFGMPFLIRVYNIETIGYLQNRDSIWNLK